MVGRRCSCNPGGGGRRTSSSSSYFAKSSFRAALLISRDAGPRRQPLPAHRGDFSGLGSEMLEPLSIALDSSAYLVWLTGRLAPMQAVCIVA